MRLKNISYLCCFCMKLWCWFQILKAVINFSSSPWLHRFVFVFDNFFFFFDFFWVVFEKGFNYCFIHAIFNCLLIIDTKKLFYFAIIYFVCCLFTWFCISLSVLKSCGKKNFMPLNINNERWDSFLYFLNLFAPILQN